MFALLSDLVGFATWNEIDASEKGLLANHTRNYYGLYLTKLDASKAYLRTTKSLRVEDGHKEIIVCSNYRVAKRHFTRQLDKVKKYMKLGTRNDWCLCLQVSKDGSDDFTRSYGYACLQNGKISKVAMPLPEAIDTLKSTSTHSWQPY